MRRFRHLTPIYIWNRLKLIRYHGRHPDHPFITETANLILSTYLRPTDMGLEFGSGRSTLWLAKHVKHLISVEHDKEWYDRISKALKDNGIDNVTYYLREKNVLETLPIEWDEKGPHSAYAKVLQDFADGSLDFVFVDGVYRSACALGAINKLRLGGFILIDNMHFWLPRPEKVLMPRDAPRTIGRKREQGPASKQWTEFRDAVQNWRYIYTSDGTQNTAFYFKPLHDQEKPLKWRSFK